MMLRHSRWSGRHIMPTGPGWITRNQKGTVASCLVWNQTTSISESHPVANDVGCSDKPHQTGLDHQSIINHLYTQALRDSEQHHCQQDEAVKSGNHLISGLDERTSVDCSNCSCSNCIASTMTYSTSLTTSHHVHPHHVAREHTSSNDARSSNEATAAATDIAQKASHRGHLASKRDTGNDDDVTHSSRHGNASRSVTWLADVDTSVTNDRSRQIRQRMIDTSDPEAFADFAVTTKVPSRKNAPPHDNNVTSASEDTYHKNGATSMPRSSKPCWNDGQLRGHSQDVQPHGKPRGGDSLSSRRYQTGGSARQKSLQSSASSTSDKLTAQLGAALDEFRHTAMPYIEDEMIETFRKYLRVQKHRQQRPRSTPKTANITRPSTASAPPFKLVASSSLVRPSTASAAQGTATNDTERRVPLFGRDASRRRVADFRQQHTPTECRRCDDIATGTLSDLIVVRAATPSDRRFHPRTHQHHQQRNTSGTSPGSNPISSESRGTADGQVIFAAASVRPLASESSRNGAASRRTRYQDVGSVEVTSEPVPSNNDKFRYGTVDIVTDPEINKLSIASQNVNNHSSGEDNHLRISGSAILTVRLGASFTK